MENGTDFAFRHLMNVVLVNPTVPLLASSGEAPKKSAGFCSLKTWNSVFFSFLPAERKLVLVKSTFFCWGGVGVGWGDIPWSLAR